MREQPCALILRKGFSQDIAAEGRALIWNRMGTSWEDCTTYGQPMVHLKRGFRDGPFGRVMNGRVQAALDQLMGANRWAFDGRFGWWPVIFPGFTGPGGWHVDGVGRQHLTSPEKGLVTLFLFSDIEPGDAGTPVVRGSHHAVARLLAEAEHGRLSPEGLAARLPEVDAAQVVKVTGEAGDVALLHPLLIHGFGPNRGRRIRFACNPLFRLREPMRLDRPDGSYSPVAMAIRTAIAPV